MAKMYVAFLLDFFQPFSQSPEVIGRITKECYRPLVELFNCTLNPKFTVSLSNSLARLLIDNGCDDVIKGLRKAIEDGKVELIPTGAYHPIFPLIPEPEVKRQIELDIDFKSPHFGETARTGILSPELCYDDKLLPLYKQMRFRWTVLDDRVMGTSGIRIPEAEIYHIDDFAVMLRSSFWSDNIRKPDDTGSYLTGRRFVESMHREVRDLGHDCYKIIAISGETFGHHVKYYQETFLRDMLFAVNNTTEVCACLVSDLLKITTLPKINKIAEIGKQFRFFPRSSWATQPEDYLRGDPYPHWKSQGNPIHEELWNLTTLILNHRIEFSNRDSKELRDLRKSLDQVFYDTQYFWASIWFWKPEEVYKGIDLQMRALYKVARLTGDQRLLRKGEEIYVRLLWEIDKRLEDEQKWRLGQDLNRLLESQARLNHD